MNPSENIEKELHGPSAERQEIDELIARINQFSFTNQVKAELTAKLRTTVDLRDLNEYQEFLKQVDGHIDKREKILAVNYRDIPLWGGTTVKDASISSEIASEYIRWESEFFVAFYRGAISLSTMEQMIRERMKALEQEALHRQSQIDKFFQMIEAFKSIGVRMKSSIFSQSRFANADYEQRAVIIESIALKMKKYPELEENAGQILQPTLAQIEAWKQQAANSEPTYAWWYHQKIIQELRPLKAPKGTHEAELIAEAKLGMVTAERQIKDFLKTAEQNPQSALHTLQNAPTELKIKPGIGPSLVNMELKLLALLEEETEDESHIINNPKAYLLQCQMDNEFVRRSFHQIVALTLCMGQDSNTAHAAQQELISSQEAVSKEEFSQRQNSKLLEFAAQEAGVKQKMVEAEADTAGLDTLSVIHDSEQSLELQQDQSSLQVATTDDASEKHQVAYWEMTRIAGLNPWPAEANEKYLHQIRQSGQHLIVTDQYKVIGFKQARRRVKENILAGLHRLPGKSLRARKLLYGAMMSFVDESAHASGNLVDNIFSYTRARGQVN